MCPNVSIHPLYGPCPKREDGASMLKLVDNGTECFCCKEIMKDGINHYQLPCGHLLCRVCRKKQQRILEEGWVDNSNINNPIVVSGVRCHCGRMYNEEDFKNADKVRVLLRNHLIDLYSPEVKVEPFE